MPETTAARDVRRIRRVGVLLDVSAILCSLITAGAAQPRQVQAQVGHSVSLQCVDPVPNITQWGTLRLFLQRPLPSAIPKVVFSFSNGKEQPDHQDGEYKNRCHLLKDNLTLSLSHVSLRDQGEYDCKVFLKKSWGYELEYKGRLVLSIWADYSRPQISVFREGTVRSAVCSSTGGYPRGDVEWIINPKLDLRNLTETWDDSDPQTLLYNVSGRLTLPQSATGSISCCVVTARRKVCSDKTGHIHSEISGSERQKSGESTVLLSLMMPLILLSLQYAGARVWG
ncbi:T-lymphocyte activation antigen CD80 [Dendrobates tinctorius]|uniref:T-lymphocyte activation antigen CD80 n=1 Tax=Dendrobates tinctorius TaxID=92724 RepID=UPI003CCA33EE